MILNLEDATQKIVLNTKGKLDDVPESLKMFLDYIETDVVEDEFTREVDKAVVEIQNDERWKESIMTVDQVIKDAANAAAYEAAEEATEKTLKKTKRERAIRMLKHGSFSDDIICEMVDISAKDLETVKKDLTSAE